MAQTYHPDPAEHPESGKKKSGIIPFLFTFVLLAWAIRSFVVAPFSIPSGSMLPTLYVGDYLLVAKWPYGYSRFSFPFGIPAFEGRLLADYPERGDVVVFRPPGAEMDYVKRVIGLPGDTVEVRGGMLVLNGRRLPRESAGRFALPLSPNSPCKVAQPATPFRGRTADGQPACLYPAYREAMPGGPTYTVLDQVDSALADHFPPTRVPPGHLFLMGDNRDDSIDSRFSPAAGGIGFVPLENLIGRALITFWSTDGSASWWKPWTWFSALREERIGNGYEGAPE